MAMWMLGKPPKNSNFDKDEYSFYIGTIENDDEDFVNYRKGMSELFGTFSLWHLADESRANELGDFFDKVMHSELNDREVLYPGEKKYGFLVDVETIKKLYELIGDIDETVAKRFTENDQDKTIPNYYALPDKEGHLKDKGFGEIDEKTGRLSLRNDIFSVESIKWFLRMAIDNNRELVID